MKHHLQAVALLTISLQSLNDLHRHFLRPLSVTTAEREENTTFPHVLVSNGTATLIITGRTPRQLPLRALSTKQKHPIAAATMPAYRAVSCPLPSART